VNEEEEGKGNIQKYRDKKKLLKKWEKGGQNQKEIQERGERAFSTCCAKENRRGKKKVPATP